MIEQHDGAPSDATTAPSASAPRRAHHAHATPAARRRAHGAQLGGVGDFGVDVGVDVGVVERGAEHEAAGCSSAPSS